MDINEVGTRARLVALVGWRAAGVEAPKISDEIRHAIAERMRKYASSALDKTPNGPDDIALALCIGMHRASAVSACGGVAASADAIFYCWTDDASERRARVALGLALAVLQREKIAHSRTDALLLGILFA